MRFAYESHDAAGNWVRSYGNENWELDETGRMRARHASINDLPIKESERLYHWPRGRRPDDHPGLSTSGYDEDFARSTAVRNDDDGLRLLTMGIVESAGGRLLPES